ncbi:MAG: ABC transporter substrate-binding protein [Dehalococcoidales bacterium]|nr:ABC transporter substrate-binding protein [Dehalococcoidales bacterium]
MLSMVLSSCGGTTSTTSTAATTTTAATTAVTTTTTTTEIPTIVATTAAESEPEYGGSIVFPIAGEPRRWDPYIHEGGSEYVHKFIYETFAWGNWAADRTVYPDIFRVGLPPVSETIGCLAESWDLPDTNTIIINLRHGIHYQNKPPVNGRELTASDVAFCFNRLLGLGEFTKPSTAISGLAYTKVTAVTVIDKYTIEIKHGPSAALWTALFAGGLADVIYTREAFTAGLDDWKNAVGTGPFMINNIVASSYIELVKNPSYWRYDERHPENKLPYFDKVKMLVIPDAATVLSALRTGKLDFTAAVSYENYIALLATNPDMQVFTSPGASYAVQLMCDQEPFTDINVRAAMQMAVNLPEMAETYFNGLADTFPQPIASAACRDYATPFDEWPQDLKDEYTYNPEGARQLLADAGYPDGFDTTINTYATVVDLAQIVKGYWEDIGVRVTINAPDRGAMDAIAWSHTIKGSMLIAFGAFVDTPMSTFSFYAGGISWNFTGNNDPVFDKYYTDLTASDDLMELNDIAREGLMYAIRQHWIVALNAPRTIGVAQPWIGGYHGEAALGRYQSGGVIARIWNKVAMKKAMGGQP